MPTVGNSLFASCPRSDERQTMKTQLKNPAAVVLGQLLLPFLALCAVQARAQTLRVQSISQEPGGTVTELVCSQVPAGHYELWTHFSFDGRTWQCARTLSLEASGCFVLRLHDGLWNTSPVFWKYELRASGSNSLDSEVKRQ